ncbi:alpha/beta hydrolase [Paracoccus aurantiacus]|nr:alpha/beta hydrolase [Paracoccus aurantiacus]
MTSTTPSATLMGEDTIADLLRHPALQGFAEHLLPWADRNYDQSMPLSQLGQLLPYHSEVRPDALLSGINRVIADAGSGKPVFHDIYSAEERRANPSLEEVGLFFFAADPGAPFAIIAPGGGFTYVGAIHEGFPCAQEINAKGLNAFVLTYRTGQGGQIATQDMARAVDYVMDHATELQVATEGYSLWGSSAGARMAAYIGSHGPDAFGARSTARPAAVIIAYTSHNDTGRKEPPTYIVVGGRDGIAPPRNMQARAARLRDMGAEVAMTVFPNLGHGFGTGAGTEAAGWVGDAVRFWKEQVAQ